VEQESVIYREEVLGMLFGVADLNVKLDTILRLLIEEFDGEEGAEGPDA
jgi:hypothetical protein